MIILVAETPPQEAPQVVKKRGNSWWVVVYTGRDPLTGKKRQRPARPRPEPRPASSKPASSGKRGPLPAPTRAAGARASDRLPARPPDVTQCRPGRPCRPGRCLQAGPGLGWIDHNPRTLVTRPAVKRDRRPARLGGGYAGESSADAERPAQEEAATEIDEIIVTGQRDYLYRADQSDALGTSIPLAELPAAVNVITEDFLEDTRAYDIEDV
jgi:hypothetical protein